MKQQATIKFEALVGVGEMPVKVTLKYDEPDGLWFVDSALNDVCFNVAPYLDSTAHHRLVQMKDLK